MLPLFRKIRYRLAQENQFLKYARYAFGEIFLIVIGIMIALQINDWNEERIKKRLEIEYLVEIRNNMAKDTVRIREVLDFNSQKETSIGNTLKLFEQASQNGFDLNLFSSQMSILGSYNSFGPNPTAFDNLVDTESISLISSPQLRTLISQYYRFDFEGGTQEAVMRRTRSFAEAAAIYLTTKENMNHMFGVDLDIKSNADSRIYSDEGIITAMVYMSVVMRSQNELMNNTMGNIHDIIQMIDAEIDGPSNSKN